MSESFSPNAQDPGATKPAPRLQVSNSELVQGEKAVMAKIKADLVALAQEATPEKAEQIEVVINENTSRGFIEGLRPPRIPSQLTPPPLAAVHQETIDPPKDGLGRHKILPPPPPPPANAEDMFEPHIPISLPSDPPHPEFE